MDFISSDSEDQFETKNLRKTIVINQSGTSQAPPHSQHPASTINESDDADLKQKGLLAGAAGMIIFLCCCCCCVSILGAGAVWFFYFREQPKSDKGPGGPSSPVASDAPGAGSSDSSKPVIVATQLTFAYKDYCQDLMDFCLGSDLNDDIYPVWLTHFAKVATRCQDAPPEPDFKRSRDRLAEFYEEAYSSERSKSKKTRDAVTETIRGLEGDNKAKCEAKLGEELTPAQKDDLFKNGEWVVGIQTPLSHVGVRSRSPSSPNYNHWLGGVCMDVIQDASDASHSIKNENKQLVMPTVNTILESDSVSEEDAKGYMADVKKSQNWLDRMHYAVSKLCGMPEHST